MPHTAETEKNKLSDAGRSKISRNFLKCNGSNVLKWGMLQKEKVVVRTQNVYLKSIKFDMHIVYISC